MNAEPNSRSRAVTTNAAPNIRLARSVARNFFLISPSSGGMTAMIAATMPMIAGKTLSGASERNANTEPISAAAVGRVGSQRSRLANSQRK